MKIFKYRIHLALKGSPFSFIPIGIQQTARMSFGNKRFNILQYGISLNVLSSVDSSSVESWLLTINDIT